MTKDRNKHVKFLLMWKACLSTIGLLAILASGNELVSQVRIDQGDPPNPQNIPDFYLSTLDQIERELKGLSRGEVRVVARSPGGRPVYAVSYGHKEDFLSQANYNSAVAARDPVYYARKDSTHKPVVFFLGPVHGQEVEGIVGLLNLIRVAETGEDHRGKKWDALKDKLGQCRVVIVPCGNPDGRKRCPYDSFVGLPVEIMTKYGQGTRTDGSSWGWPMAKSLHPMKGNVGILGAYFNDEGINMMHDDWFSPMAAETEALLEIARSEAPDVTVSLHSHHQKPRILPAAYVPWYMKQEIDSLTRRVNNRYEAEGLPHYEDEWLPRPRVEDEEYPPKTSLNLIPVLHHVSGTMAFTFECSHGTLRSGDPGPMVSYEDILDIQLYLYQEMLEYILEKRLY